MTVQYNGRKSEVILYLIRVYLFCAEVAEELRVVIVGTLTFDLDRDVKDVNRLLDLLLQLKINEKVVELNRMTK